MTIAPFPEGDRATLSAASDEIAAEWAADLDKRGKPGTAVLGRFRQALSGTH